MVGNAQRVSLVTLGGHAEENGPGVAPRIAPKEPTKDTLLSLTCRACGGSVGVSAFEMHSSAKRGPMVASAWVASPVAIGIHRRTPLPRPSNGKRPGMDRTTAERRLDKGVACTLHCARRRPQSRLSTAMHTAHAAHPCTDVKARRQNRCCDSWRHPKPGVAWTCSLLGRKVVWAAAVLLVLLSLCRCLGALAVVGAVVPARCLGVWSTPVLGRSLSTWSTYWLAGTHAGGCWASPVPVPGAGRVHWGIGAIPPPVCLCVGMILRTAVETGGHGM